MKLLESLRAEIAYVLSSQVKAQSLVRVCSDLGLEHGDDAEAWQSKHKYVVRRLQPLKRENLISLAKAVLERYPTYGLEEKLDVIQPSTEGIISPITRRKLI